MTLFFSLPLVLFFYLLPSFYSFFSLFSFFLLVCLTFFLFFFLFIFAAYFTFLLFLLLYQLFTLHPVFFLLYSLKHSYFLLSFYLLLSVFLFLTFFDSFYTLFLNSRFFPSLFLPIIFDSLFCLPFSCSLLNSSSYLYVSVLSHIPTPHLLHLFLLLSITIFNISQLFQSSCLFFICLLVLHSPSLSLSSLFLSQCLFYLLFFLTGNFFSSFPSFFYTHFFHPSPQLCIRFFFFFFLEGAGSSRREIAAELIKVKLKLIDRRNNTYNGIVI